MFSENGKHGFWPHFTVFGLDFQCFSVIFQSFSLILRVFQSFYSHFQSFSLILQVFSVIYSHFQSFSLILRVFRSFSVFFGHFHWFYGYFGHFRSFSLKKHWKRGGWDTPGSTPAGSPPSVIHCAGHPPSHPPPRTRSRTCCRSPWTATRTCSPGFFRLRPERHVTELSQGGQFRLCRNWPVREKPLCRAYANWRPSFQRKNTEFQWIFTEIRCFCTHF